MSRVYIEAFWLPVFGTDYFVKRVADNRTEGLGFKSARAAAEWARTQGHHVVKGGRRRRA